MHSSRVDFSSLHTQQGFTFVAASPWGFRSEARFDGVEVCEGISNELSMSSDGRRERANIPAIDAAAAGEEENQPIFDCGGAWEAWAQRGD